MNYTSSYKATCIFIPSKDQTEIEKLPSVEHLVPKPPEAAPKPPIPKKKDSCLDFMGTNFAPALEEITMRFVKAELDKLIPAFNPPVLTKEEIKRSEESRKKSLVRNLIEGSLIRVSWTLIGGLSVAALYFHYF